MRGIEFQRRDFGIQEGFEFDHLENEKCFLPYSSFDRWIPEDDIWMDMYAAFPLGRLGRIGQLSFLSYVGPNPEETIFNTFPHTRLNHSQLVANLGGEIARGSGAPHQKVDQIKIKFGIHDIGTVAHGDATKKVDPENLDEENLWKKVVGKKGLKFIKEHGLTEEEVDDTIHNRGIDGKLLDITDRISYTMMDLRAVLGDNNSTIDIHPYLLNLRYIMSHNPNLGDIYKEIGVDWEKEDVVFSNKENLGIFLLLRAHLFNALYMHPTNQGRDLFIARMIAPFYAADGSRDLSPDNLTSMEDYDLINYITSKYGYDELRFTWDIMNWHPEYEKFETLGGAEKRKVSLRDEGFVIVGSNECNGFNPSLYFKTIYNNEVIPFDEADPEMARNIRGIVESTRGFYVFYTKPDDEKIGDLLMKIKEREAAIK